jgi:murein DD-endopeptidase MepM/ murein hydrolase activator NlpD
MIRLRGTSLSQADEVVFMGAPGDADDVVAETAVRRKTSADVTVPLGAAPGPVSVVDRAGAFSVPSVAPVLFDFTPVAPPAPVELGIRAPKFVYDAAQPATLTYVVHGAAATLAVDLVRVEDGVAVAHWDLPSVAAELPGKLTWDGLALGKVQRTGRYEFRVAANGAAQPAVGFDFVRDQFPILGKYSFGTGVAAFGGGRGHQGEDVFAACGTPLVAAHGGTVRFAGFQSRAGNYLVIDNEGTGTDYAYMHLREAALVTTGTRVRSGQLIGFVGDSGDATACHLHFELWTAPGWYAGGRPIDPLPTLRSWVAG